MKCLLPVLLLLSLAWGGTLPSGFGTQVEADHPVYGFLAAVRALAQPAGLSQSLGPFSVAEITAALQTLDSNRSLLQPALREQLDYYKVEFSGFRGWGSQRHFFADADAPGCRYAALDLFTGAALAFSGRADSVFRSGVLAPGDTFRDTVAAKPRRAQWPYGARLQAQLGSRLSVMARGRITTEAGNARIWQKVLDADRGQYWSPVFTDDSGYSRVRVWDDFTAQVAVQAGPVPVLAGLQNVAWGPAPYGSLAFSGRGLPFLGLRYDAAFRQFRYTYCLGKLVGQNFDQKKYLYAHRFEYQPLARLTLGWYELLVDVERTVDPLYLLPVAPFFFKEHFAGNPSNKLMGADVSFHPTGRTRLYAEVMLDDLQGVLNFFDDYWANKWAFKAGAQALDLVSIPSLSNSLWLEYTRIEPWVFTSSVSQTDAANHPVNFGQLLGDTLGPNGHRVDFRWEFYLPRRVTAGLHLAFTQKGDAPGSSFRDQNPLDTTRAGQTDEVGNPYYMYAHKQFLGDDHHTSFRGAVTGQWVARQWLSVAGQAGVVRDAYKGETQVYPTVNVQCVLDW